MTQYAYDGNDRIQTITDPVSRTLTFAYDGSGKLQSVTDDAGRITQFTIGRQWGISPKLNTPIRPPVNLPTMPVT